MRNVIETATIFIIQTVLWHFIPWSYEGVSKLSVTIAYLSLFAVAFSIVCAVEMAWEEFTGKEIPD